MSDQLHSRQQSLSGIAGDDKTVLSWTGVEPRFCCGWAEEDDVLHDS